MAKFTKDEEVVPKILSFLKRKPHFFDESNPLFYDAFQKIAEKTELARSFEPALTVPIVSAKIRYIIHKVIDDFYLIKRGKKPKFAYFEEGKFMLPALMTELKKSTRPFNKDENATEAIDENSDDEEYDSDYEMDNEYAKPTHWLKKLPKNEQKSKETYCKICNFFCPPHLYSSHFELRYHQRAEITWKQQNYTEEIQCPCCDQAYGNWLEFLKHIKIIHQLEKEDINYKVFIIKDGKLSIDMDSDLPVKTKSSAQLFH